MFCFDVKLKQLDLSFPCLLRHYRRFGSAEASVTSDPAWVEGCQTMWQQAYGNNPASLHEMAVTTAKQDFIGGPPPPAHDAPAAPEWQTLLDGTPVTMRFEFGGRSDGWLVFTEFDGAPLDYNLECRLRDDARVGRENKVNSLFAVQLVETVARLRHRLEGAKPELEVETQAASIFFGHLCARVDSPALRIEITKRKAVERARFLDSFGLGRRQVLAASTMPGRKTSLPRRQRRVIPIGKELSWP